MGDHWGSDMVDSLVKVWMLVNCVLKRIFIVY